MSTPLPWNQVLSFKYDQWNGWTKIFAPKKWGVQGGLCYHHPLYQLIITVVTPARMRKCHPCLIKNYEPNKSGRSNPFGQYWFVHWFILIGMQNIYVRSLFLFASKVISGLILIVTHNNFDHISLCAQSQVYNPHVGDICHSQSPNNGILKNNCCNIPF